MIIFFTDSHFRATNPRARLDNFIDTALEKLQWVINYANENNASAILHGGDWMDRPDMSYSILGKIIPILMKSKAPIYTVLGNHDIYGYNPSTVDRTALSLLFHFGIVNRLSVTPIVIDNFSITGVDANFSLDKGGDEYTNVETIPGKKSIHVVHGFLSNVEWPNVACTLIEDITHTKADIILTGHEHKGFAPITLNGTTFCNPGALLRCSASVGDVNSTVQIAVISDKGGISLVDCPIAKPAEEVLDRVKLSEEKQHKQSLDKFSSSMDEIEMDESFNIYDSLYDLCKQDNISQVVMEICRKALGEADEEAKKEV